MNQIQFPSLGTAIRTAAPLLLLIVLVTAPSPAAADPVFDGAVVSPPVISPNGDLVQDFAVIDYTVKVDTAQVVVRVVSGGIAVATLQPLANRARGDYTLLFDGRDDEDQLLPDGDYDIVLFGVGTQGEGSETVTLELEIDTTPPKFLGSPVMIEPEVGYTQNGDLVVVVTCVEGADSLLTADFSALDSGYDPADVTVIPTDPTCRRIEYTVTPGNTRLDAAGLEVPVTAIDRGGNVARSSLQMCLLNAPPRIADAALVVDPPVFQNGDRIRATLTVVSPAPVLEITADFSALDSGFDSTRVVVRNLGAGQFEISYQVSDQNDRLDGEYPFRLIARDPGCGLVDTTLTATLINEGQFDAVIANVSLSAPAFSPNDDGVQDEIDIFFTALLDTTLITIKVRFPGRNDDLIIQEQTEYLPGDYSYRWDGSTFGSGIDIGDIDDGVATITVNGVDTRRDRRRNRFEDVLIDRTPPQLQTFTVRPAGGVTNSQVLEISATYPQSGHALIPDLIQLDSEFGPGADISVNENIPGTHIIRYVVSPGNTRDDAADIVIPIQATDIAGNTATSNLVRVCLSNRPPRLVSAKFTDQGDQPPFTGASFFVIETLWESSSGPLTVAYDFSDLDSNFDPSDGNAVEDPENPGVFRADYRIGSNNERPNGIRQIFVTAVDQGCGLTQTVALEAELLDQDVDRPEFNDDIPGVTRDARVLLTGVAFNAALVEISRDNSPVDTLDVVESVFEGMVDLIPGANVFQAVALDRAGNRSPRSSPVDVLFVEDSFVDVPKRFRPGNSFFLGLLEPAQEVTIRIYNLEGLEIRRLTGGPGDLITIPWDGFDNRGNLSSSGPYIALIQIVPVSGSGQTFRQAFVFTRR